MSIDDCNGCRSEDCDACVISRQHAKHDHCLDCRCCLLGEERSVNDGDRCMRCVPCVQECGCDSEYEHAMAEDEAMHEFLRNPGPPPTHFTDEQVERARSAIDSEAWCDAKFNGDGDE